VVPVGRAVGEEKEEEKEMPDPKSRVDRSLPWVALIAAIAGVLITALSGRTPHLPGIALESKPLFLIERGGAVVVVLILIVTVLGRTLNRELPNAISPATGAIKYAETVAKAATSSENAATRLETRLDKQDANLSDLQSIVVPLRETVDRLVDSVAEIAAFVQSDQTDDPPKR
jgi:hypothetical protein